MKPLISEPQAQAIMVAILIAAPLIGLLLGFLRKRPVPGLVIGLLVGVGNYALWTAYNAITNKLGLDTVKNLAVNVALFIGVGLTIGFGAAYLTKGRPKGSS